MATTDEQQAGMTLVCVLHIDATTTGGKGRKSSTHTGTYREGKAKAGSITAMHKKAKLT